MMAYQLAELFQVVAYVGIFQNGKILSLGYDTPSAAVPLLPIYSSPALPILATVPPGYRCTIQHICFHDLQKIPSSQNLTLFP